MDAKAAMLNSLGKQYRLRPILCMRAFSYMEHRDLTFCHGQVNGSFRNTPCMEYTGCHNVATFMVARQSHVLKYHQYDDHQCSSWGTK